MTTRKSNTPRSRAGTEQHFNQMIAVQERVDDQSADQQSNTSRSQEGNEQHFNQMIAVQERVDDEDADQQSNTSRKGGEPYFNQMNAVQERVDDEAADQQSNTSRSRAGGEQYFNRVIAMQERVDDEAADHPSDVDDDYDNEDSCFTTQTVDSSDECNVYGNPEDRPEEDEVLLSSKGGTEDGAAPEDPPVKNVPGDVSEEA